MSHSLSAHLGTGHFNAAFIADYALVTNFLILPAEALEVLVGPKILSQKRPSLSGFKVR
jgi:hypothetical protein